MEEKCVSFEMKKKGVKSPLASKENVLLIDTPLSKKHVVAKFASSMKVGTIQLVTTRHVKALVGNKFKKKVRLLGEALASKL